MGLSYYTMSFLGSDLMVHCFLNIKEPMGFDNRLATKNFPIVLESTADIFLSKKVKSRSGSSDILAKYTISHVQYQL